MKDSDLKERVRQAFARANRQQEPEFARVFAAAEQRVSQSRRRYMTFGGIAAAAAIVAIVAGNWTASNVDEGDEFLIADALLNSTQWTAPSDALMPSHQFDIYQDIPVLMESTEIQEGSLL